jgi:hypothetical protein
VYHELQMRRCLSILLVLTFALGPLSVLADGSEDANLPACCRRDGAHACSMKARRAAMRSLDESGRNTVGAPETCPVFPGIAAMFASTTPALAATQASAVGAIECGAAVKARNESALSSPLSAHAGRGPPVNSLS